jgi:hypothetical protein
MYSRGMLDRIWWFSGGVAAGIWVTVRSLRRKPTAKEWSQAALSGSAAALDLAAKAVRPNRQGQVPVSR